MFAIRSKRSGNYLLVDAETHQSNDYGIEEELVVSTYPHLELYLTDYLSDSQVIFVSSLDVCEDILKEGKSISPEIRLRNGINLTDLEIVELGAIR